MPLLAHAFPVARRAAILVAASFVVACGGEAGPDDDTLVITLAGGGQVDTVGATYETPLVATVSRDGRPAPGVQVRFTSDLLRLQPAGASWSSQVSLVTNATGQAAVAVIATSAPGTGPVVVEAVDGSATNTAQFTILPGNGVAIAFGPADTAVVPGASYVLSAQVVDRHQNPLATPVTLTALTPGVLSLSGATARGESYGRGAVRGMATLPVGVLTADAFASVVPPGRLTLSGEDNLAVANTDGSGFAVVTGALAGLSSWSPDGSMIAFSRFEVGGKSLYTTGLAGNDTPLISDGPTFDQSLEPRFSADGSWVYFTGFTHAVNAGEIWRIHPDGNGLERVGKAGGPDIGDRSPSPSPDGTRVVFGTSELINYGVELDLVVRDVSSGDETPLGVTGFFPAWSPAGDLIAYWRPTGQDGYGTLWTVPAEGGPAIEVPTGGVTFHGPGMLAWSPDGEWIALPSGDLSASTVLVRVSDGLVLPLKWSGEYGARSWHADPLP